MFPDIFNDDAFSLVSLTASINNIDHVPSRAGELVFAGIGEGVATETVAIESRDETLSLIQTSKRGAPAPKAKSDKAKLFNLDIPQVKFEDTIRAHEISGVRQFGSADMLVGAQSVVNARLRKMSLWHDLTLEHHRLGALRGIILDADGSTLLNLFTAFGVTAEATADWSQLTDETEGSSDAIRTLCHQVTRTMRRNAKTPVPATARIWAFCGDNFFDALVDNDDVKNTYKGYEAAQRRLGGNYAFDVFEYGGIFFENYQGTDDNETVAIDSDECQFFWTGVPGMYAEYFAPADFFDTVNTIGLPRYARMAVDQKFNQFVELHTQQNPLPLCLHPKTLMKATLTP